MATNEQIIRDLYLAAEVKDVEKFISTFTDDGLFWDVSAVRSGTDGMLAAQSKSMRLHFPTCTANSTRFIWPATWSSSS